MHVRFISFSDAKQRAIRTLVQFIVSGGLMLLLKDFVVSMDPGTQIVVLGVIQLVVSFVHNWAEDHGYLPAVGKAVQGVPVSGVSDAVGQ